MKNIKLSIKFLLLVVVALTASQNFSSASSTVGSEVVGAAVPGDSSVFPALSSVTASSNMLLVSSTPIILYGIHLSSNAGAYVAFFSTGASPATMGLPSTTTVVGMSPSADQRIQFNPPLRFPLGLATKATGCPSAINGWCYTVIYDKVGLRRP